MNITTPAAYLLLGDPDWVGMLFYAVVFFGSIAGFVLTVYLVCKAAAGNRKGDYTPLNLDGPKGDAGERR